MTVKLLHAGVPFNSKAVYGLGIGGVVFLQFQDGGLDCRRFGRHHAPNSTLFEVLVEVRNIGNDDRRVAGETIKCFGRKAVVAVAAGRSVPVDGIPAKTSCQNFPDADFVV